MSLGTEYAAIIRANRRVQLAHLDGAAREVERIYSHAAERLREEIRTVTRGIAGDRYRRDILAIVERELELFRAEYKSLLDAGIVEAGRLAADRENALLDRLLAERGVLPPDQSLGAMEAAGRASVEFGSVPRRVLERAYVRTYRDGRDLYERLYKINADNYELIRNTVMDAIARGQGPAALAKDVKSILVGEGMKGARQKAITLARTEINSAYREAHVASVTDAEGNLKSYVSAIGWRLSRTHPRIDICDAWAGDDTGLGPGNYLPENVPAGHARCLCATLTLLAAYPDLQFAQHPAHPDDVPEGQRIYYGAETPAKA
jgi:hypothetical protein